MSDESIRGDSSRYERKEKITKYNGRSLFVDNMLLPIWGDILRYRICTSTLPYEEKAMEVELKRKILQYNKGRYC